jgi:hypothetical protein
MPQDHAGTPTNSQANQAPRPKRTRSVVVDYVVQFEQRRAKGTSQRQFAQSSGVPRTSLQHWLGRKSQLDSEPELIAFFESPVGVAFLHRLVTAAHVVFSFLGTCGSRLIGRFLQEAGLGPFVATSKGSQHHFAGQVERAIIDYGDTQHTALASTMAPKSITVCQDETFHPQPCLVAIEPVANFIVLECYDDKRDATTWNAHMAKALAGLPVKVKQSTSDEAKGIISHVRQGLGAHHSPDVFHVQHELGGALARPLAQAVDRNEKLLQKSTTDLAALDVKQAEWEAKPGRPAHAPDFASRRTFMQAWIDKAKGDLAAAQQRQAQGRQAIRGVGDDYHPVDLNTGELRPLQAIEAALEKHFESARAVVMAANLNQRAVAGIEKAARVLPTMVATLAFFLTEATHAITVLGLAPLEHQMAVEVLLPALYLDSAAKKAKTAARRRQIAALAETLRRRAYAAAPRLKDAVVTQVLLACSQMFQRASSCVEGRNGQLALRHHCLHSITSSRLNALTVVHNYAIEDAEKTTAAERFFGRKPTRSLFEHVQDRVTLPGRPAAKRPRRGPLLVAA